MHYIVVAQVDAGVDESGGDKCPGAPDGEAASHIHCQIGGSGGVEQHWHLKQVIQMARGFGDELGHIAAGHQGVIVGWNLALFD